MSLNLTFTDLFCGAGGSSVGAVAAGARLAMAANHWPVVIETHNANFPDAPHDCADISQVDPRRYPRTDLLFASPECTFHSSARTSTRRHLRDRFDPNGDPSAERSRATMWDVPRFVEVHRYEAVVVENVVEAVKWAPFSAWLQAMASLGYDHELVSLNSLAAGVPQSRDRLYVVFWQHGNRRPDLRFDVDAWCPSCETNVAAVQSWRNPDRAVGKYRFSYLYRCPQCSEVAWPNIHPAGDSIDWTVPVQLIGDRARALSARTRARVGLGLEQLARRNGRHSAVVDRLAYRPGGGVRVPWPVRSGDPVGGIAAHLPRRRNGAPRAFIVKNYGDGTDRSMAKPLTDPFATVTTQDHHSLITLPDDPSLAVTVADVGLRMLEPHELARAMAFPSDYRIVGSKRDRCKQIGNAVTAPAMTLLTRAVIDSLTYHQVAA